MPEERVTLYGIALSHPVAAALRAARLKGVSVRYVQLPSGAHPLLLRMMGFRRGTVPALRLGSRRIQGSRAIARTLDAMRSGTPLYPADPARRARVEEAERWGAEVLQGVARRLFRWALVRDRSVRRLVARRNRLPLPGVSAVAMKPLAAWFAYRRSGASDPVVRRDLAALPHHLDRVDRWIADGILDRAAELQIASSLRLLVNFEQLAPAISGRPCGRMALARFPSYPGEVPAVFPAAWLPCAARAGSSSRIAMRDRSSVGRAAPRN